MGIPGDVDSSELPVALGSVIRAPGWEPGKSGPRNCDSDLAGAPGLTLNESNEALKAKVLFAGEALMGM